MHEIPEMVSWGKKKEGSDNVLKHNSFLQGKILASHGEWITASLKGVEDKSNVMVCVRKQEQQLCFQKRAQEFNYFSPVLTLNPGGKKLS